MIKKIIIIFLLWLLVINIFAIFSLNRLNLKADTAYEWINPNEFFQEQKWDLNSIHNRWDSSWYLDIAENGYSMEYNEWGLHNIVFFPIYPFLIKIASFLTMGNFVLAGWILSILFLLLALFYLFKLVKEFHQEINPYAPVILLLIFPTAFFLNTIYTESLFLFLSLATFYYGLKKKFVFAGIFGLLASLTRVTGVLLFIPIIWEYFKTYNFKLKSICSLRILPIFLIPIGTFSFFLYHYFKFGNFFLFFEIEKNWGRTFSIQEKHFELFSNPAIANLILDAFFILFVLIIIYLGFKKLRTSYSLYMLSSVAVALSTGTFMSIGRYILVLFPIYILLSSIKNQYLRQAWVFVSILLLALYTILFVSNYWAG
ncbi:MAG: mannosyltransferase family protein [Patescibacteria group bacterium]|nr:mannosyltransferase family protein [Patescibacteria group bacterium]